MPSLFDSLLSISFLALPIFAQISSLATTASFRTPASTGAATIAIDKTLQPHANTAIGPVVDLVNHRIPGAPKTTKLSSGVGSQTTTVQRCNGYAELCDRKLSNVTLVVAHNSPFVVAHNGASNQELDVLQQLQDGIRGLQFETHYPNNATGLRLCHTTCELLDAGPLEAYLRKVTTWLHTHPNEVLTITMGNSNRVPATTYMAPFRAAGLLPYLYTPPTASRSLSSWPTLAELIAHNTRVVVLLDYAANQTAVPWLLDEFAYLWETPFSPTDPAFPCTLHRPPNLPPALARDRLYMLNHNLNIDVGFRLLGQQVLVPAYTLLDQVNARAGDGSLGRNVALCEAVWDRPPSALLVDYYDLGDFAGSAFEVAAVANGVEYNRSACCGVVQRSGAAGGRGSGAGMGSTGLVSGVVFALLSVLGWV